MANVAFQKAVSILDKLLEGKTPKEIAYELKVSVQQITETKKKFPLFTGLVHKYERD